MMMMIASATKRKPVHMRPPISE